MPVLLTNTVNTGDLDGSNYYQAKIVHFEMDMKVPYLKCIIEWGNTTDGVWIKGERKDSTVMLILNEDEENTNYDDYVEANRELYNAVRASLYTKAIALKLLAGDIV